MVKICTQTDSYLASLFETQTVWIATLSNEEVVYQDDGREDTEPDSAWERLGIYCEENGLHVVDMMLQNGTNTKQLGKNLDGYYFCKGASGFLFSSSQETIHSYVTGGLNDGLLSVKIWNVPELSVQFTETRDPFEAGICLITKKGILSGRPQN